MTLYSDSIDIQKLLSGEIGRRILVTCPVKSCCNRSTVRPGKKGQKQGGNFIHLQNAYLLEYIYNCTKFDKKSFTFCVNRGKLFPDIGSQGLPYENYL